MSTNNSTADPETKPGPLPEIETIVGAICPTDRDQTAVYAAYAVAGGAGGQAADLAPRAARPPIGEVDNASLTEADMMQFIVAAVDNEGLVGHNIKAFNDLINEGIPQILTELFDVTNVVKDLREQTVEDRQRESVKINFRFMDVRVGRPVYATYPIGKIMPLFPNECRLSGRTYAAPLSLAAEVTLTAYYADGREETKRAEIPPFMVAPIPAMVGGDRCHTSNLTREARKGLEEDPNESGGYFLAKGGEWVVDWLENISFNTLHVYKRMQPNERVRGDFISQPGGAFENSSQVIIRYMANTSLTIEINSTKFSKTRIPFFFIFRLLGMTSDADILEQIVYDPASESPVVRHMVDVVGRAIKYEDPAYAAVHNELDREKLTEFMAVRLSKFVTNPTAYKSNEHAIQYLNDNLLSIMDRFLLPHIGRDSSSRGLKLRYLGMMVHKTLLVDMGILEPTDRDSYSNKRVHGAGISIAKAFKTQFNNSVVMPVMRALKREIRNTPFEELSIPNIIDAFKNPMASSDLGRTLEQAVTSGNKTIVVRRRAVVNRVSTQALERKNPANYYSALRAVSTHTSSQASKQTERADKMRRVHASYTGFICVAKSADTGEMVGMKKELAITASVCSAGQAYPLVLRLKEDPAITHADSVRTPDLIRKNLACIFVNGAWIGCCASAHELVGRYRRLRREGRVVDPQTTIVWNPVTDDVDFLLDVGRLTRPLIIVDNNIEAYDAGCRAAFAAKKAGKKDWAEHRVAFVQNIRLTPAHIAGVRGGTLSLEDLRAAGVMEWITPQEAENTLVAPSLDALRAEAHVVTSRYTHCDVEQVIFGLTALVSPFGNHTQPARVTYETNQGRQAGGWYSFAAPFRVDKNRFFQHYCEAPLVRTIAYNWLFPNGMNTIVAYMIDAGYNQEDSAVVKSAFAQRGGFAGGYYKYEKAELEKGEFFGSPDITTTKNLKPNASYEKLVDGFVPPGTIVHKGDVLIGRIAKIQASSRRGGRGATAASAATDDGYKFVDRSVVYHLAEPAVVTDVFRPRGPNDNIFGLVKLRYHRPLGVGDKMSSRAGNKSITALLRADSDLPFDEDGITPDIIINPHSIPSRMTIGQMLETSLGLRCQAEGCLTDGTSFRKISVDEISKELADIGLRYNGLSRLYNGRTGEYYDAAIFMGPTYHQRLQKFVKDDEYAVGGYGPTDALTGQPLDGKNARGGLRIGEMEAWVLQSQGSMMSLTEKMFLDSDGRKQFLCRGCGIPAIYNAHQGIYRCNTCGEGADIGQVDSCKASIVFQHEMRSANVKVTLGTRPREFEEPL
jgi:DNA-directed RNA polymerase beta subunit